MAKDDELSMIMEKSGDTFVLYACRGEGRGCQRNKYRARRVHCDDCLGPLDQKLSLGAVLDKLRRGDA